MKFIQKALGNLLGLTPTLEPTATKQKVITTVIVDKTSINQRAFIVTVDLVGIGVFKYHYNYGQWLLVSSKQFIDFDTSAENELVIILFKSINMYTSLKNMAKENNETFKDQLPYEFYFMHNYTYENSKIKWVSE